ncbi:fibroblast growth factor-binding protein 2b isoform X1 [Hippocampus comes]|uniref:fibroblast growth factor-binding protein 2b isoform X1 n=1 Tax=Hippocampus comes TaxID=109280 RepID=UPI00094ECC42|nr:PREDICTED: fibroblast growth factor-binding protein 2 isoform X1 [Hippocampus comes]
MRAPAVVLVMAAWACACHAQTDNSVNQQQRSIWDEPIRFSTKSKDACTMVVSGASDHTRLRVSCKGPTPPGAGQGRAYYCDFQGKPNLCRAYSLNPRHYFTQIMWELRKLSHACQGAKVYRPPMCKKHPDEVQMSFLSAWPRAAKPAATQKPQKPQTPVKPQAGKAVPAPARKTTPKPAKTTARSPTELPESKASRIATEYCWKSFHGICTYFIGWFKN